jgi:hypothetical protein
VSGVTVHVDDSIVPKIARLGPDVAPAFDAWVTRMRREGRKGSVVESAIDEKLELGHLTPSTHVLTWWLATDMAYVWDVVPSGAAQANAASTQCVVDPRTGQLRVTSFELPLDRGRAEDDPGAATRSFTARVSPDALRRIGAPERLLVTLLAARTPADLERLRIAMPQHEPLLFGYRLLARGVPMDQVVGALTKLPEHAFDASDYRSALLRSIDDGRIRVLAEETDLAQALSEPWSHWQTYLHPEQRAVAYRPRYNGPAKVTGGPGTGKTIVAVHRVRCLLEQAGGLDMGEPPILLTSFVTSTVHQLTQLADALLDRRQRQRVQVVGVDRLCARLLRGRPSVQRHFQVVRRGRLEGLFAPLLARYGVELDPGDAISLWENVVLAAENPSWKAALSLRQGLGLTHTLDASCFDLFLRVCVDVQSALLAARETTYVLLLRELLDLLPDGEHHYRHVVIDEAQDLHPLHWRMLRRIVPRQSNDLFLVGDGRQRLYRRPYALSQCGIETRNRSKVLRLSYRSSQEILDFATALLGDHALDDMEVAEVGTRRERSVFSSAWPECVAYATREAEVAGIAARLSEWRREGMDWGEMMVAAASNTMCADIRQSLDLNGIPGRVLARNTTPSPHGVSVMTWYRAKGLEARAVIVAGARQLRRRATAEGAEAKSNQRDAAARLRRALYVACTRGRERLVVTWTRAPNVAIADAIASGVRVELETG